MRAVCCDALNPGARPNPRRLKNLGVDGARLVLHHDAAFYDYHNTLKKAGLQTAVVFASESRTPAPGWNYEWLGAQYANAMSLVPPDLWLIGNEPNAAPGAASSWVMKSDQHVDMFNEVAHGIRSVLPSAKIYIGGMLGTPQAAMWQWGFRRSGYDRPTGIDIHYPETESIVFAWRDLLPTICMEWCWAGRGVRGSQVREWERMLERHTEHSAWYCWSAAQGEPSMSLVGPGGRPKAAYYNYKGALHHGN